MVQVIYSYEEYLEVIKNNENVVVDCYADWCGPCRMLAPIVEKISEELVNIKFIKVNIDNIDKVAIDNQIYSIPTLLCLKNATMIMKSIGFKNEATLKAELSRIF